MIAVRQDNMYVSAFTDKAGTCFSSQVWVQFRAWARADFLIPDDNFSTTEDWWLKARAAIPKPMRRNFDTIAILLHWRIWKERNARIFDNVASALDKVRDLTVEDIVVWRVAGCISDLAA
ncbi:hypothetical protein D1007_21299 [Hordeum vulgare]|nr:hypothetical protein D1007_21299 [Hordeum vulgare]